MDTNISKLNVEEKIDFLNDIEDRLLWDDITFFHLKELANDDDAEIRSRVAILLVNYPNEESEKILLNLISDADELVRVNACDSLSFSSSLDTLDRLKSLVVKKDKVLVRGYAVLTIADIALANKSIVNEVKSFLIERLNREMSPWVRICYYSSLNRLGEVYYFKKIVNELNNRDYRIRSFVIRELYENTTDENSELILKKLSEQLLVEHTNTIRILIENILGGKI